MFTINPRWLYLLFFALASQFLIGCAEPGAVDPWEKSNRFFYNLDDGLDKVVLKPLADGYVKVIPKEIRAGIGNGFANLQYFDVILNDFLQGKWQQGCGDSGRMAINSTIGIAGVFDFATPLGLPSHDNDFGVTLGKWGADAGPYMVLPFFGPSCVRDAPGIAVGILDNPVTWVNPPWYVVVPLTALNAIDSRAQVEGYFKFRNAAGLDPYLFTRSAYLQYRQNQILEGKPAPDNSIYDEDTAATQPAATSPAAPSATQPAPAK